PVQAMSNKRPPPCAVSPPLAASQDTATQAERTARGPQLPRNPPLNPENTPSEAQSGGEGAVWPKGCSRRRERSEMVSSRLQPNPMRPEANAITQCCSPSNHRHAPASPTAAITAADSAPRQRSAAVRCSAEERVVSSATAAPN